MPIKSFQLKNATKQRKPIKHAACKIDVTNVLQDLDFCCNDEIMPSSTKNLCLLDIKQEFEKLSTNTGWRLYFENKIIHLQYFKDSYMHGIATISFLISENDGQLSFSVTKNGRLCQFMIDQISLENWSLEETLSTFVKLKCCSGYQKVIKEEGWLHMPAKFCPECSPW